MLLALVPKLTVGGAGPEIGSAASLTVNARFVLAADSIR
jgi:hypothetical protein